MQILVWIFVGLVAGWIAGKSLEGNGYGRSVDLAMGVAGAVIGGFVTRSVGFSGYFAETLVPVFMAISCAALLTIVAALMNGRTIITKAF